MSITEINTSNRSTTTNTPNNSSVTMTASRSTTVTPNRQAAINGLAVVGFVALIIVGISLAVYSTRFVPTVVSRVGSAAVYLGSIFTPSDGPTISVVSSPTASTTISFGTATTTSTSVDSSPATTKPIATTAGEKTSGSYQVGGTASAPYGLPNLAVNISVIGYLTTSSADSFVGGATVPSGNRPAIKFTIKNIGTNWTGTWRFKVSIPTRTAYIFQSEPQQTLAPGDSIDYTLGFDRASIGSDKTISITANSDNAVNDSNANNNTASADLTIL